MPKVNIDYRSPLDADTTFSKVKEMLNSDVDLRKIDSSINFTFADGPRTGTAKGSKFQAEINVAENSQVSIVVDLPFILGAFKGQVKSQIEKKLAKILA